MLLTLLHANDQNKNVLRSSETVSALVKRADHANANANTLTHTRKSHTLQAYMGSFDSCVRFRLFSIGLDVNLSF